MKWLADENFRHAIVRGLWRRAPKFDIVRVQDLSEISGVEDSVILVWATSQDRAVLTHDLSTMIPAMRELQHRVLPCAPIVLVPDSLPTGQAIEEILLLDECSTVDDWTAGVLYLPLR